MRKKKKSAETEKNLLEGILEAFLGNEPVLRNPPRNANDNTLASVSLVALQIRTFAPSSWCENLTDGRIDTEDNIGCSSQCCNT